MTTKRQAPTRKTIRADVLAKMTPEEASVVNAQLDDITQRADEQADKAQKVVHPPDVATVVDGLPPIERKKLTKLEDDVLRLQRSFIALIDTIGKIASILVGRAGFAMSDRIERLFIGEYVRTRFDIDSVTWSRYRDAQDVIAMLREAFVSEADLPRNEGQCRELAKVLKQKGKDELVNVWKSLIASKEKITADAIKQHIGEAPTGMSRSPRPVTPLQSLESVESLAKKSEQKTYVSVVARCSSDEAQDLVRSVPCKVTEKDGVNSFEEFQVEDLEETLVKMAAWVGSHPINALQLNIVRS